MDLLIPMRNILVGTMATRLNGGSLVFYDGTPARKFPNALVVVPLPDPAFGVASGGEAVSQEIAPVLIALRGEIGWAQFVTADGVPVANATVDATAEGGDIVLNRLDVQRGGEFTLKAVTLRLPATP